MEKTLLLPSLSRVTPGSKATSELPIGPTYKRVIFTATGTALAASHIGEINVLFGGRVVQRYTNLQRLIDVNSYWNRGSDSVNQFALHFFRGELVDNIYRAAPGIGTADLSTFHVEIKLDAAAPADIEITAHAEIMPGRQPLGVFYKVREYPVSSSVAGWVEVDKLPKGPYYSAIHLFKDDISEVLVEIDQVKITEATKAVLERTQEEAVPFGRVPLTAKATHLDYMLNGDPSDSIDTAGVSDFRLKMYLDTAGSLDIVTETLDTLEGAK